MSPLKHPLFRTTLALALTLFCAGRALGQGSVLVIIADDVGVDRVGAYGGTAPGQHPNPGKTPNIDRLAGRGVLFRNAWASPICTVARATMLTGRHGFRTGIGANIEGGSPGGLLSPSELCLPALLNVGTNGAYTSIGIGKWHLGSNLDGDDHPLSCGFDHFLGNRRGFGPGNYYRWRKIVDGALFPTFTYATTSCVDDALRAFEASSGPMFVWLAFNAPHQPLHRPPNALHSFALSGPPDATPVDHMKAMTEAMDSEIGRLLASLSPARRAETTVIFIGDNGTTAESTDAPFLPEHAKTTVFEGGVHVPLIIAGPTVVSPGRESEALVQALDIYSTVAELAGVDPRAYLPPGRKLDSISLCPLLEDPLATGQHSFLYSEIFQPFGSGIRNSLIYDLALRGERYKFLRARPSPIHAAVDSLFDLSLDPFEQNDLLLGALSPEQDQAYQDFLRTLERLLDSEL